MDVVTYALLKNIIAGMGSVFSIKGQVQTINDLPSSGNKAGYFYLVGPKVDETYDEYYWNGYTNNWEFMGSTPNLDDYVKNTDYAGKNDGASGIVTPKYNYCFLVSGATGIAYCPVRTYNDYKSSNVKDEAFISKGTLENVIAGKELVNKTYVDDLVGNIDTLLTDLNSGGGVE